MRIAYLDCFSGISGDMLLGALLHAGVDEVHWREGLRGLGLEEFGISVTQVSCSGIAGVQVDVIATTPQEGHGRHLSDIAQILHASTLPATVQSRALAVFTRLAEAEARIHSSTPEDIHFHEVGAVDALVDIAGACLGLEMLGIERVYVSPLPYSRGWVKCMHGSIPTPAPATLALLTGFAWRLDARPVELVTPTGAALAAEWAERTLEGDAAPLPAMTLRATGYGAGQRKTERPNMLRLCVGDL